MRSSSASSSALGCFWTGLGCGEPAAATANDTAVMQAAKRVGGAKLRPQPLRRAAAAFFAGALAAVALMAGLRIMYFQLRGLPWASHSIAVASRFFRVASVLASVIHARYSRRWLGENPSKVVRAL